MKKLLLLMAVLLPCLAFVSCDKDEDDSEFEDVYMFSDKTRDFKTDLKWTSSNELVAYVKDNKIYSLYVGTATMKSGKYSFKVTVTPFYDGIYMEPCLNWGCSMSDVKKYMSGYEVKGTPTVDGITFYGRWKEDGYVYVFNGGKLSGVGVVVKKSSVNASTLAGFIKERYPYVGQQLGTYTYLTIDKKTIISLTEQTTQYVIMYLDANSGNSVRKFDFQDSFIEE